MAMPTRLGLQGWHSAATWTFASVALERHDAFWGTWYGVVLALLLYDFCYYWLHRAGHVVALFWAAHVPKLGWFDRICCSPSNRFVQPLPLAQLWVLSTYYVAQLLIVLNILPRSQNAET